MERFAVELRAGITGDRLEGHAAVFDVTADLGKHYERLARTAFDQVIDRDNVRALVNHDPSQLLGTTNAGTLKVSTDSTGLAFEIPKLPDTTYGRDLREMVGRGDLDGMSFGFIPGADEWSRARDGRQVRTHTALKSLLDISPVTFPAYSGTDVSLRRLDLDQLEPVPDRRTQTILARHRARSNGGAR